LVTRLDAQVELVADVGAGGPRIGGGTVTSPGMGVDGVLLATIAANGEDRGPASRLLCLGHGTVIYQLGLGGLTVDVNFKQPSPPAKEGLNCLLAKW